MFIFEWTLEDLTYGLLEIVTSADFFLNNITLIQLPMTVI